MEHLAWDQIYENGGGSLQQQLSVEIACKNVRESRKRPGLSRAHHNLVDTILFQLSLFRWHQTILRFREERNRGFVEEANYPKKWI